MNTNKKIGLSILTISILILFLASVQGAVTWINPTASSSKTGSIYANLTSAKTPLSNCSITISSALSGDSATALALNYTGSGTALNFTLDTTTLEDANDYVFAATCYNTTGGSEAGSITGVIIDNTVPTAPSSITPSTSDYKELVAISSTVVGTETTSCTAVYTSSYSTETVSMTHSGNTCTHTYTFPGSGDWTITVTASDGTNRTSSSASALKITETGGLAVGPSTSRALTIGDKNIENKKIFFVLLLGLGVYVAYQQGWLSNGGSSRQRRSKSRRRR